MEDKGGDGEQGEEGAGGALRSTTLRESTTEMTRARTTLTMFGPSLQAVSPVRRRSQDRTGNIVMTRMVTGFQCEINSIHLDIVLILSS